MDAGLLRSKDLRFVQEGLTEEKGSSYSRNPEVGIYMRCPGNERKAVRET